MRELALFAGAGGGILGGKLLGWRTVCAVEIDAYARSVLLARQADGCLERFPIWDDIQTFDGEPWRGHVDVISGGFPCQDISAAGRGAGIEGSKSGLWMEMARIICEVRPRFAFVENSPMLTVRGLGRVLGDLATLGYDAEWGVLGACDVGAPHRRDRIWIVACHADGDGEPTSTIDDETSRLPSLVANTDQRRQHGSVSPAQIKSDGHAAPRSAAAGWWSSEPDVGRVADGVASKMDRLAAIGNGQVPAVAALAWEILMERLEL